MPPGAAGAQSRPDIERATDILWFDFGHRSWRRRAALVLGRRIALAYRASLGGASQITSTALQIARIFDHVTWCEFGVIQVADRSWSTADLNLVGATRSGRRCQRVRDAPGDIHRVRSVSETTAISVHTTAPTSSRHRLRRARRCYDWPRWIPKVKPPPDYRRSSSRVTRLRPPVLDLTRRLRHR
jgi:hypothetical protein